jgi:hypothetical protein
MHERTRDLPVAAIGICAGSGYMARSSPSWPCSCCAASFEHDTDPAAPQKLRATTAREDASIWRGRVRFYGDVLWRRSGRHFVFAGWQDSVATGSIEHRAAPGSGLTGDTVAVAFKMGFDLAIARRAVVHAGSVCGVTVGEGNHDLAAGNRVPGMVRPGSGGAMHDCSRGFGLAGPSRREGGSFR